MALAAITTADINDEPVTCRLSHGTAIKVAEPAMELETADACSKTNGRNLDIVQV
jgi:hypothetical protein